MPCAQRRPRSCAGYASFPGRASGRFAGAWLPRFASAAGRSASRTAPAPCSNQLNGTNKQPSCSHGCRSGDGAFHFVSGCRPPEATNQLPYHFELTMTRATIIKRAHDLGASVTGSIHTGPWPAQFSPSDWSGFEEIVPHMWWRLKARPYAAVVVARGSFDGFVWLHDANTPARLGSIAAGSQRFQATRLSPLERDGYDWKI